MNEIIQELKIENIEETLKKDVCLYYHLGQCLGYCKNELNQNELEKMINDIKTFLNGDASLIKEKINNELVIESEKMNYERCIELKKMLDAGLIEQSEYDAKKAEILSAM